MKKLTAGIFAGILTIVTVNAANADIASKAYVDQEAGKVSTAVTNLTNGAVKDNADAIAAINDTSTGILATAEKYADAKVGTLEFAAGTADADKDVAHAIAHAVTTAGATGTNAAEAVDAKLGVGFTSTNTVEKAINDITKENGTIDTKISGAIEGLDLGTVSGDDNGVFTAITEANGVVGGTKSLIKNVNVATDAQIAESKIAFSADTVSGSIKSLIKEAKDAAAEAKTAAETASSDADSALDDALGDAFGDEGFADVTAALATKQDKLGTTNVKLSTEPGKTGGNVVTAVTAADGVVTVEQALTVITKPAADCTNPGAKCVLTVGEGGTYAWEVVQRNGSNE